MPATLHTEGLPPGRGVYVVEPTLTEPGNWRGKVTIEGQADAELAFPVSANPDTPIVGAMAPRAREPDDRRTAGHRPAVHPHRRQEQPGAVLVPPDRRSTRSIGKGKPVIVMFATPARCQSRYCGPVLDQLIAVAPEYQDRITPIHVEIYKDLTSNDLVTATETWLGISGEPWIFAMDGTGKVTGRLSGAFATDEIQPLIDQAIA